MSLDLIVLREPADLGRLLSAVGRVERLRGHLDERRIGSNLDPSLAVRAAAAAVQSSGRPTNGDGSGPERGYADTIRLIMAHAEDLPFSENQIKYLQSLIVRHDDGSVATRRRYRDAATAPASSGGWSVPAPVGALDIAEEMGRLVAWTRETLEAGLRENVEAGSAEILGAAGGGTFDGRREVVETGTVHPLVVVAVFLGRLLVVRPFASGTTRLAFVLSVYFLDRYGYHCVRMVPFEEVLDDLLPEGRLALAALAADPPDASPWVRFVLEAVVEAEKRALALSEGAMPVPAGPEPSAGRNELAAAAPEPVARLHPRAERVLTAMRERRAAKIGDLLPALGIPRATLKKDLRVLVEAGHLVSHGARKGTVYYAVADPSAAGKAVRNRAR